MWSRKKFELETAYEHRRIILEKRRTEVRCTLVVSQRPGCLRYLPKILCDNINYSQSQWRCSLFHIYRAHQFSAVSRVTGRKFSSKRWTWAIIQRHLKNHSWPAVRYTVVVPQRRGCLGYLAKIWRYCVTTLIIHNHGDGAVYFHIYRAHQFSAFSRVTGRNFSSKCWTWAIIQRDLKNHPWRATAFVCTACDSVPLLRYCTHAL